MGKIPFILSRKYFSLTSFFPFLIRLPLRLQYPFRAGSPFLQCAGCGILRGGRRFRPLPHLAAPLRRCAVRFKGPPEPAPGTGPPQAPAPARMAYGHAPAFAGFRRRSRFCRFRDGARPGVRGFRDGGEGKPDEGRHVSGYPLPRPRPYFALPYID